MDRTDSEIVAAIEVFTGAIVFGKRHFGPYHCSRIDGLWVMHDDPGRKGARRTEAVAFGKSPAEVDEILKAANLGRHFLCDIHAENEFAERREAYKKLGYKAMNTEWFFVHRLKEIPRLESDPPVRFVETQSEADAIPQLAAHKLKVWQGARNFRIWDEHGDYGWVQSIDVGAASWVQGLWVRESHRRRGYGSALMSALLQCDKTLGREASVLLASSAGSKLYPLLGYEQIAILQVFGH